MMDIKVHLNERAEKCWNKFTTYRLMVGNAGTGLSQATMKAIDDTRNEFRELWSELGITEQTNIKLLGIRKLMYDNRCGFNDAAAQFDAHIEGTKTCI